MFDKATKNGARTRSTLVSEHADDAVLPGVVGAASAPKVARQVLGPALAAFRAIVVGGHRLKVTLQAADAAAAILSRQLDLVGHAIDLLEKIC